MGLSAQLLDLSRRWRKHPSQRVGNRRNEHLDSLPPEHPPPARGQAGGEASDYPSRSADLQTSALEDLLTGFQDPDSAALAAAAGAANGGELGVQLAVEEVGGGGAAHLGLQKVSGQKGDVRRELGAQAAG